MKETLMIKRHFGKRNDGDGQFNMTAMIDVVFLLIIFFMLICQFIAEENVQLIVPDDCEAAVVPEQLEAGAVVVNVFLTEGEVVYIVKGAGSDGRLETLKERVELQKDVKGADKVLLRADKGLRYDEVQGVLEAVAGAKLRRVDLAAFQSEQRGEGEME